MAESTQIARAATQTYHQPKQGILAIKDFRGGLNRTVRPQQLEDPQVWEIKNLRFAATGLRTREGVDVVAPTASTPMSSPVQIIAYFNGEDVAGTSAAVYRNVASAMTKITNVGQEPALIDAGSHLLICDGNYLKFWDGTTFGLCYDKSGYMFDATDLTAASSFGLTTSGAIAATGFNSGTWDTVATTATTMPWVSFSAALSIVLGSPAGTLDGVVCDSAGTVVYTSTNSFTEADLASTAADFTFNFSVASTLMSSGTDYRVGVRFVGSATTSSYVGVDYASTTLSAYLYTYNATSWATSANYALVGGISPGLPPKARTGCVRDRRVYLAAENSQLVYYNAAGDVNDWSTSGVFNSFTFDEDSGYIIALVAYSRDNIIIFKGGSGKAKSIQRLTGTEPATTVRYQITRGVSAINHKCAVLAGNECYFLDESGVYEVTTTDKYGDLRSRAVSGAVETYLRGYVGSTSYLAYDSHRGHVYVRVDTGPASAFFLVYDMVNRVPLYETDDVPVGPWMKYDFNGITEYCACESNGRFYVADTTIYLMSSTSYKDGTALPDVDLMTKFFLVGSPLQKKLVDTHIIDAETNTGGTLTVAVSRNNDIGEFTSWTHTMGTGSTHYTDLDMQYSDWDYPYSTIISSSVPVRDRKFAFMTIMYRIHSVDYSAPVYINGIYLEYALLDRRV